MKIKVLIVEDEVLIAEDLASDLETYGFEIAGIATRGTEAIKMVESTSPHVILMDINLKSGIDGIETAEKILDTNNVPIIYISSNTTSQFINRAFATKPHAFLSKPINTKDLILAIELAFNKYNESVLLNKDMALEDSIFVRNKNVLSKILLNDILFIEAEGSYCKVHAIDSTYLLSFNLNHFQTGVKNKNFKRVHRSYIVNLSKVNGFDTNSLLINDNVIPVSSSYREKVFQYFNRL